MSGGTGERAIRFDDGEAYERFMGAWSRSAGEIFLDWLAPAAGLRWVDVGCGNGAFTELLLTRAGAAAVEGVDPSAGQLAFARTRLAGRAAGLREGVATALPFGDGAFDAAAMALVIFFVPEPERGVAEMVRVTRPGGAVAAYAWDIPGGGFPTEPVTGAMRRFGIEPLRPPRADVSTRAALEGLWAGAGLAEVQSRVIEVERRFAGFEEWWTAVRGAGQMAAAFDALAPGDLASLREAMREQLAPAADGQIRCRARANAVRGVRV